MKKVLMVLGIVLLVVIAGIVALLVWAGAAGSAMQEEFFAAVLSDDPSKVTAMFHPALNEEVDQPVLAAWMSSFKKNLGSFQGLSKTDFNTSTKYEDGQKITESSGTVNFEKGQANAELVFVDGKLAKFLVKSDKLPDNWFVGPLGTELYQKRGKEFLTHFMSNQPDQAFAMMHPALQKKLPLEKLKELVDQNCSKAGNLQAVNYVSENYDPDERILVVRYDLECENAKAKPTVKFEFVGLKGHLIAFNLAGN